METKELTCHQKGVLPEGKKGRTTTQKTGLVPVRLSPDKPVWNR